MTPADEIATPGVRRLAAALALTASCGLLAVACGQPSADHDSAVAGQAASPAAGDDSDSAFDPASIPAEVATVATGGWWSADGAELTSRVVIAHHGFDHVVSSLYVQWLELAPGAPPRILRTTGFEEINQVPLYALEIAGSSEDADGFEVVLDGRNSYTNEAQGFVLRIGPPGEAILERR